MTAKERYAELIILLAEVANLDPDQIRTSRKEFYPTARAIIWYQMRAEGYFTSEIGVAAGKNHSTVIQITNKLADIIKEQNPSWRTVLRIWNIFQCRINTECPNKKINDNLVSILLKQILSLSDAERTQLLSDVQTATQ